MTRVSVSPRLLRWARERAGIGQSELARNKDLTNLPAWERRDLKPTLRQLEKFAHAVHVPFGYLFLREPPDEPLPITDFRTVGDAQRTKLSPHLIDTIYAMQRRQEWLSEYLADQNAEPLAFVASARLSDDPSAVGREIRGVLGIGEGWAANVSRWQDAVYELRRLIERLGVMAVINGVVGNNTHRPLDVKEFRGFALTDRYAPLIFVNGADAKSAQMFTLAHELAHVWLGEGGLSGFENLLPGGTEVEDWCNKAAAEILAPSDEFRNRWMRIRQDHDRIADLGRHFKVSPVVVARRALDLRLIGRDAFFDFYELHVRQDQDHRRSATQSGGDFYANQNARVGKLFATHVIGAAMEGQIGFREAYELTGLRGGTFQDYASRLGIQFFSR